MPTQRYVRSQRHKGEGGRRHPVIVCVSKILFDCMEVQLSRASCGRRHTQTRIASSSGRRAQRQMSMWQRCSRTSPSGCREPRPRRSRQPEASHSQRQCPSALRSLPAALELWRHTSPCVEHSFVICHRLSRIQHSQPWMVCHGASLWVHTCTAVL